MLYSGKTKMRIYLSLKALGCKTSFNGYRNLKSHVEMFNKYLAASTPATHSLYLIYYYVVFSEVMCVKCFG